MEFDEQPLSYEEARRAVSRFEEEYKLRSATVFSGTMEPDLRISPDALYEWKSYFDFICEVDHALSTALADHSTDVESIIYSSSTNVPRPRSYEEQKLASLKVAA